MYTNTITFNEEKIKPTLSPAAEKSPYPDGLRAISLIAVSPGGIARFRRLLLEDWDNTTGPLVVRPEELG